jgi:hypothetical protein
MSLDNYPDETVMSRARRILWSLLVLALARMHTAALADNRDVGESRKAPFYSPRTLHFGEARFVASAIVDALPYSIVGDAFAYQPKLLGGLRYGLPQGFSLSTQATAGLRRDELLVGLGWTTDLDPISLRFQASAGVWYGSGGTQDNNLSAWSLLIQPELTLGVRWGGKTHLAFKGEIFLLGRQRTILDGRTIVSPGPTLRKVGYSVMVSLERRVRGQQIVFASVGVVVAEPNYEAWLRFSDNLNRYAYPRLMVGYEF